MLLTGWDEDKGDKGAWITLTLLAGSGAVRALIRQRPTNSSDGLITTQPTWSIPEKEAVCISPMAKATLARWLCGLKLNCLSGEACRRHRGESAGKNDERKRSADSNKS